MPTDTLALARPGIRFPELHSEVLHPGQVVGRIESKKSTFVTGFVVTTFDLHSGTVCAGEEMSSTITCTGVLRAFGDTGTCTVSMYQVQIKCQMQKTSCGSPRPCP